MTFGAGLGRCEAQRRGLGTARVPNSDGCAAEPLKVQPRKIMGGRTVASRPPVWWSIFVRHHHGDGGLRVVDVERAAGGNQFDKPRCAVVVADIQRNG